MFVYRIKKTISLQLIIWIVLSCCNTLYAQIDKPLFVTLKSGKKTAKIYYHAKYSTDDSFGKPIYANGENEHDVQNIDFQDSKYGRIEIEILKIEGMRKKHKFLIKSDCPLSTDHVKHIADDTPIQSKENGDINKNIEYQIIKDGKGEIIIKLGITDNGNNINETSCNDGKIVIRYNITGVYKKPVVVKEKPKPKPPSESKRQIKPQEEFDWKMLNKEDINALGQFIEEYPYGKKLNEAKERLKKLDDFLWNKAGNSKAKKDYEFYTYKFRNYPHLALRYDQAEIKIDGAGRSSGDSSGGSKKIDDFLLTNPSEEDIVQYIKAHAYSRKEALNHIITEFPKIEYSKEKIDDRFKIKILNPYFNPRYKNISLSDGLIIDHSSWQEEYVLNIEVNKDEDFKIIVTDSLDREIIIPFGNTFDVDVTDTDEAYVINILGGKKPYTIELFNEQTKHSENFETNSTSFLLSKEKLLNEGFLGEYTVKVKHNDRVEPLVLSRSIYLKESKSNTLFILIFAALLLLSSGLFYYLFKKRKGKHKTIFK